MPVLQTSKFVDCPQSPISRVFVEYNRTVRLVVTLNVTDRHKLGRVQKLSLYVYSPQFLSGRYIQDGDWSIELFKHGTIGHCEQPSKFVNF